MEEQYELKEYTDFEIIDLGIKEEWVYDIEVEDNHNFFGNNILVHNSAYLIYNLPFNKFEDIHQLVDYVQKIARELGKLYNGALEYYGNFANLNPTYNTMDFKSEVIAYRGFFGGKKFYSLATCWDEGTFFEEEPYLKKTGGAIVKSDTTPLSRRMLDEVYNVLVKDYSDTSLVSIYRKIFVKIKNKYKLKIKDSIKDLDFAEFSTPKKWGNTEKTIPPFVIGAMLYNTLIGDTFRPSDSMIALKVKIDVELLIQVFKEKYHKDIEFCLTLSQVEKLKNKINMISIPTDISDEEKKKLLKIMNDLNIQLLLDEIIMFNIDMKLDPFERLFNDDIRLRA